jgi:hypothetical protein
VSLTTEIMRPHPLLGQRAAGQDRDRAHRSSKWARRRGADRVSAVQAGLLGRPGGLQRRGGEATVVKLPDSSLLPGRKFDPGRDQATARPARADLTLTATIPADLLHEGINTIACAIVPGAAERRIEHVVSFLVTAPQPPSRRDAIVMPGRPVWNKDALPLDVQRGLSLQFGAHRVAVEAPGPVELNAVARQMWFPARAARTAVVKRTAAQIRAVLPRERERTAAITHALEQRGFRPVVQRPPTRRPTPDTISDLKEPR